MRSVGRSHFDRHMRTSRSRTSRLATAVLVAVAAAAGSGLLRGDAITSAPERVRPRAPVPVGASHERVEELAGGRVALTYADVTGADRTVVVELRRPEDHRDTLRPVVVWSHGGSTGRDDPRRAGVRWGRVMVGAGAVFVAIAHPGRSAGDRAAVCDAVGAADCATFDTLLWDRPHDVSAVLDWLSAEADVLGIDAARVVHGGHSAGAIGVLTTAGMEWPFDSRLTPPPDPRPIAFLVASPPGRDVRGLSADSFSAVDRPVLFLTGLGDTTAGTDAVDRRATFDLLPSGPTSHLLWADDERARHMVFDLAPAACERAGGTRGECRGLVRTVARVGLEFVRFVVAASDAESFADRVADRVPHPFTWSAT